MSHTESLLRGIFFGFLTAVFWAGAMPAPCLGEEIARGPEGGAGTELQDPAGRAFDRLLREHPEALGRFDLDGNGAVDDQERSQAIQEFEKNRQMRVRDWLDQNPSLLREVDRDGDGLLDEKESIVAWNAFRAHRRSLLRDWTEKNPDFKRVLDLDQDGVLSDQELSKGIPKIRDYRLREQEASLKQPSAESTPAQVP